MGSKTFGIGGTRSKSMENASTDGAGGGEMDLGSSWTTLFLVLKKVFFIGSLSFDIGVYAGTLGFSGTL